MATTLKAAQPGELDRAPGFGLYVHWPFCLAKCPYCDFNSHVAAEVEEQRWARALVRAIDRYADEVGPRGLDSIFFGGGTPSLMAPATVAAVIERATTRFAPAPDLEITLEANPTSTETARLGEVRAAGVNRVSLGVQALDDAALRFLGREHTAAEALAAVALAARLFGRFSFDLIYARPDQTPAAWASELERALRHAGGHLSAYQLTVEPGTRFDLLARTGALRVADDEVQADLYQCTQEVLAAAGLAAYEISNHARPGESCRHNLHYWRSGEWLGIGPGAHGRLERDGERIATEAWRLPKVWLERAERSGTGERTRAVLSRLERVEELLVMGLRLAEGVDLARLQAVAGAPLAEILDTAALERLAADGLLEMQSGRLATTAPGRQRLDALLRALLRAPGSARSAPGAARRDAPGGAAAG
jgi:putative oxygen-independent coproporphyrinogen III oxidase